MLKQKLISVLQSRIAKRRKRISSGWLFYKELYDNPDTKNFDAKCIKDSLLGVGIEQKEDKQILKQLVEDEREIKRLRNCATNLQSRIDLLLGWNK